MTHPTDDDQGTLQHRYAAAQHYAATQHNTASQGGTVYAAQGGPQHIYNAPVLQENRRIRGDTWMLLSMLVFDVAFFFYGSHAYTGQVANKGDQWRAILFLIVFGMTIAALRRWWRRRF